MSGYLTFVRSAKTLAMTSQFVDGFTPVRIIMLTNKQLHREKNKHQQRNKYGLLPLKILPA